VTLPAEGSFRRAPGSFRDPQGQVIEAGDVVYRALYAPLAKFPETWSTPGPLSALVSAGKLWPSRPLPAADAPAALRDFAASAVGFLEHPRLDPITYPFEWPFELLRRAALLHLDVHEAALAQNLTLADGYAYNVQFQGTRPVFIDALAFMPCVETEAWAGYSQFCESFLNPLLLMALGSRAAQDIYRARIRGIETRTVARELGWWGSLRRGVTVHVMLGAMSEGRVTNGSGRRPAASRAGLQLLLRDLRRVISKLALPAERDDWSGYELNNSYAAEEKAKKLSAVREFVASMQPKLLLDIGCNAGEYSEAALSAGAARAVGFERDAGAIDRAVKRADRLERPFLPLQLDIRNLSPAQGWQLSERTSLPQRLQADALLCLALIHHLVLGEGAPLSVALPAIVALAPRGVIEFVPRDDPMALRISGAAGRTHHPYDYDTFIAELSRLATVGRQWPLTTTGRVLVEYSRP
jgi:ribosomal protein L11 methylase PrmA